VSPRVTPKSRSIGLCPQNPVIVVHCVSSLLAMAVSPWLMNRLKWVCTLTWRHRVLPRLSLSYVSVYALCCTYVHESQVLICFAVLVTAYICMSHWCASELSSYHCRDSLPNVVGYQRVHALAVIGKHSSWWLIQDMSGHWCIRQLIRVFVSGLMTDSNWSLHF